MGKRKSPKESDPPPIYIVSGGDGSSGEHLLRTALAQFDMADPSLISVPRTIRTSQVERIVRQAADTGSPIAHTLVDPKMRDLLAQLAHEEGVMAIDLIGQPLNWLSDILRAEPMGRPGRYRQLRRDYFERIDAIEFTVAHDDGRNAHELDQAEIVLVGASRLGKTPLSIYLGTLGWRTANVPIVPEVSPPDELSKIDAARVVGLTMRPGRLISHRKVRSRRLGINDQMEYANPPNLRKELDLVNRLCKRHGFSMVDVTNKPIEESAQDVIEVVPQKHAE